MRFSSVVSLCETIFGPVPRVDLNGLLPSWCSVNKSGADYEAPYIGAGSLYPSSSTETESGFHEHQEVPANHQLRPGQRASARSGASPGMIFIQVYAVRDYLADVKPPQLFRRILQAIRTGTFAPANSIMVPRWRISLLSESIRLQTRFPTFWRCAFLAIIAIDIKSWINVVTLFGYWRWARGCRRLVDSFLKDFMDWRRNIDWVCYKFEPERTGTYRKGDVWIISRDKVCLRVPKSLLDKNAVPTFLESSTRHICFPYTSTIHVVRSEHSSTKIRAFLDYLQGIPFERIMGNVNIRDSFRLRAMLYIMAREYAKPEFYDRYDGMFLYREWTRGTRASPVDVFSVACRTENVDPHLIRQAMRCLEHHEVDCRDRGITQNWVEWFSQELCIETLELHGYTTKMHPRNQKAFDYAHASTMACLPTNRLMRATYGTHETYRATRNSALIILTDTFCKYRKLEGLDSGTVEAARNTLRQWKYQL